MKQSSQFFRLAGQIAKYAIFILLGFYNLSASSGLFTRLCAWCSILLFGFAGVIGLFQYLKKSN